MEEEKQVRKKKTEVISRNYLDRIPLHNELFSWSADENGAVTLDIENKGIVNRIAQKLLKKPRISHVHLDEMGSFIWPLIDGEKSIADIGIPVKEHFGEKAEPLYERLAKYFQILESYSFITWAEDDETSA
ncbi:MAG: PqqD family protein [Oscillospiraceae bacterium]|nr:PqqD family protein [Oscillospiraceae bacterium]